MSASAPVKPLAIPLVRADLTGADQRALAHHWQRNPFADDGSPDGLEADFSHLWQRPAVAFAEPVELVAALKSVLGWPSGRRLHGHPLLAPAWREAFAAAWLHLDFFDIDAISGRGRRPPATDTSPPRLMVHPFGLPDPAISRDGFVLEEVSSLVKPWPGSGDGSLQLLQLDGNRILQAGGCCLALSRDAALIRALKKCRRHSPGPAARILGRSQLAQLDRFLARRQRLADRYLALHHRQMVTWPSPPGTVRAWDGFFLHLADAPARMELAAFLNQSGIGAASPVWFTPPGDRTRPGLRRFMDTALALPLYAALGDHEQKRIINRLHRWLQRTTKRR